jgi:hypothetical protein
MSDSVRNNMDLNNVIRGASRDLFELTLVAPNDAHELAFMIANAPQKHPGKLPRSTKKFGYYTRFLPIATTIRITPCENLGLPNSTTLFGGSAPSVVLHICTLSQAQQIISMKMLGASDDRIVGIFVLANSARGIAFDCEKAGVFFSCSGKYARDYSHPLDAFVNVLVQAASVQRQKNKLLATTAPAQSTSLSRRRNARLVAVSVLSVVALLSVIAASCLRQ